MGVVFADYSVCSGGERHVFCDRSRVEFDRAGRVGGSEKDVPCSNYLSVVSMEYFDRQGSRLLDGLLIRFFLNSFIVLGEFGSFDSTIRGKFGIISLSGIDAVKRIVETEAKARKIVEDSKARAQDILQKASKDIEAARAAILEQAQRQRDEILSKAKVEAEADAGRSDVDTDQMLANYEKAFRSRKDDAVEKTVQLTLRG